MKHLIYIRFATYALLAAAYLWPSPKVRVIAVDLAAPDEIGPLLDAAIRKRQTEEDIGKAPGFSTTVRSGSEVLGIALARARKDVGDLSGYRKPTISLFRKEERMKWLVSWDRKGIPIPGGFFSIWVDDATGDTEIVPGM